MEKETTEARIRNLVSPIYQLTALLELQSKTPDQKMQLIEKYNLLDSVKTACNRIIQLGKEHSR